MRVFKRNENKEIIGIEHKKPTDAEWQRALEVVEKSKQFIDKISNGDISKLNKKFTI